MERFNFNLFFSLDAILNARTLTDAAKKVYISQPAMSVSLKKLRAYYGDDLVNYSSGHAQLTALGEVIRPRIREVLRAAREALEITLKFDPAVDDRVLTFAAPDVIELHFLRNAFARIAREAPKVACVSNPFSFVPVASLFREPLDVAIVSEPFASTDFAREHLFTDTLSCVIWRDNSRIGESLTEELFFECRHAAIYRSQDDDSPAVDAGLYKMDERKKVALRATSVSALPHMVVGTDLIATTLTRFAHYSAQTLPIRVLPIPFETAPIRFVAQWREYRSNEPVIQWIVAQLKAAAAEVQSR